jgi:hypothetical protein
LGVSFLFISCHMAISWVRDRWHEMNRNDTLKESLLR